MVYKHIRIFGARLLYIFIIKIPKTNWEEKFLLWKVFSNPFLYTCSILLNLDVHAPGETAGLRVPRAGLNQHKQPHWMCHGCLFRSARPEPQDIGGQAQEKGPVPMDKYVQLPI